MNLPINKRAVMAGYMRAALFAETDDEGVPLSRNYTFGDIAQKSINQLSEQVDGFLTLLSNALEKSPTLKKNILANGRKQDDLGSDLYLTANDHGAGFWDGDWETENTTQIGEVLTGMAKKIKQNEVHVGDDGQVYLY